MSERSKAGQGAGGGWRGVRGTGHGRAVLARLWPPGRAEPEPASIALAPACPVFRAPSPAVFALLLALAVPAIAQNGDTNTNTLARVEVVGSRIQRVDLETSKPVIVLEREQLERSGLMSVGDILQNLTVHGAALNTTVNNGGDGTTRIDLRNLGDQRTLVLVDGRRWIAGIDGAVDLNSIPLALVERIEVLKDGASAIYGSDAIAGVVNISTRKDFTGRTAHAHIGQSKHGDGRVQAYDASIGHGDDRTHGMLGLSYLKQAPIFAGEREISAVPVFPLPANDVNNGASSFTPNGLFGFGSRGLCPYNPAGSYPANGRCALPDARPLTQNRSTFDPATDGYRLFDPRRDGYNFAPENYLQTPQRRLSAFGNLRHELGEVATLSLQAYWNQRESAQRLAANPLILSSQLTGASRITVPANHVYNPFGQPVTGLTLRPGGAARRFEQNADTTRFAAAVEGSLEVAERLWLWNLDAVHGRYQIDETTSGLSDLGRLGLALGPSFRDAAGIARRGTPAAVFADCVPFDAFHGPDGLTPEMLDYVYYVGHNDTRTEATNYRLGLSGDLIDLPAGPLAFAAGYEYRREEGESRIDPRRAALDNLANNSFGGEVAVGEAYLELALPLLDGARGAELLEASFAGRRSDYDSFGAATTFEGGLRWKPVDQLLLRASYSEGFRAPIVSELYFPAGEGFGGVDTDPCAAVNQPTPEQRANCLADGVPGGVYTPDVALYRVINGGNPDLQPETSSSRAVGLVWNPHWLPGFDLGLDWYLIEIEDAIAPVDAGELLSYCAEAAVAEACARTSRSASGELLQVDGRLLNSGQLKVQGYDLTAGYRIDTDLGQFDLIWDSTYYTDYRFEVPRGSGERSAVGHLYPYEPGFRRRSNLDLAWQRGSFSAALGLRYYSKLDEPCTNSARAGRLDLCSSPDSATPVFAGQPENRLGSRTYVDLQGGWDTPWNSRLVIGVLNAFDRDPPVSYSALANSFDPSYPIPGRIVVPVVHPGVLRRAPLDAPRMAHTRHPRCQLTARPRASRASATYPRQPARQSVVSTAR